MKLKVILSSVLGLSIALVPLISSAKTLYIHNETKNPFTVIINNYCSCQFGVIKVREHKIVNEGELINLCGENKSDCKARIINSTSCNGQEIANFTFDPINGLKVESNTFAAAKNYSISVSKGLNEVFLTETV